MARKETKNTQLYSNYIYKKSGLYHMNIGFQCQEKALSKGIYPMALALINTFVV